MVSKKLKATLQRVITGHADANIPFSDLIALLNALGFKHRVRGDHHILWKPDIPEIINLQPKQGKVKPYQVRQVRGILIRNKLGFDND